MGFRGSLGCFRYFVGLVGFYSFCLLVCFVRFYRFFVEFNRVLSVFCWFLTTFCSGFLDGLSNGLKKGVFSIFLLPTTFYKTLAYTSLKFFF